MSELERYRSFSYLSRSDRIEERLMGRFLPRFDDLLDPPLVLLHQSDVTDQWSGSLESTVRAHAWSVVPGVRMVLVLLDDEDFGREIKWFFKTDVLADYKHLVMAAEGCTEMLASASEEGPVTVELGDLGDRMIRSTMFCFSFPASGLDVGMLDPQATWQVTRGISASVVRSGERPGLRLQGKGRLDEHLLLLLRAQVEILSGV